MSLIQNKKIKYLIIAIIIIFLLLITKLLFSKNQFDEFNSEYSESEINQFKEIFTITNVDKLYLHYNKFHYNDINKRDESRYWKELCIILRKDISEREIRKYDTCKTYPSSAFFGKYEAFRLFYLFPEERKQIRDPKYQLNPIANTAIEKVMIGKNEFVERALQEAKSKQEQCLIHFTAMENDPLKYKELFLNNFDNDCYEELGKYNANFTKYKLQFIEMIKNLK